MAQPYPNNSYAAGPAPYPQPGAYPPQAGYNMPPPQAGYNMPPPQAGYPPQGYGAPTAPQAYPQAGYPAPAAPGYYPPADNAKPHTVVAVTAGDDGAGGAPSGSGYAAFMNKAVRQGFIRKVYAILTVQLLVTFGVTFLFVLNDSVKTWVQTHPGALYSAFGLNFAFIIALACCRKITKTVPHNYILLALFTLTESYLIGVVSSFYNTNAVLIAFGICMGVTIGLTIFACQTKIDFTVCAGVLVSLLWSLIIFGFLMIWFRSQALMTFYAWIGAFIFSCFIVVDTQMIVGGKHALQFTPDDYIAAALNLYLDIVNLFLYILRIVGKK